MVVVRELQEGDLHAGFLHSLESLRATSDLDPDTAREIFSQIASNPNHTILVAVVGRRVVGCATILIERKFIHGGRKTAHIEDVAVDSAYQGQNIGSQIISRALQHAESHDCYKTVLTCSNDVMPFYEGLGFRRNANALRFNHN